MYWFTKLILLIFTLLLVKCEKKVVSLNSDSIDTTIEFKTFKINPKNTYTYSIDADSLGLSNSERLYAGFIDGWLQIKQDEKVKSPDDHWNEKIRASYRAKDDL